MCLVRAMAARAMLWRRTPGAVREDFRLIMRARLVAARQLSRDGGFDRQSETANRAPEEAG
jgi:hypothetical protein